MMRTKQRLEIGIRIKRVRGSESQDSFAAKLNTIKQTISKYENGLIIPGGDFLCRLHQVGFVNINWLFTGEGNIYEYSEKELLKFRDWLNRNHLSLAAHLDFDLYRAFASYLGINKSKETISAFFLNQKEQTQ